MRWQGLSSRERVGYLFAGLFVVALTAGCRAGPSSTPSPKPSIESSPLLFDPKESSRLMPLAKGNRWTYLVTSNATDAEGSSEPQTATVTYTITEVKREPNRVTASFELSQAGRVVERQTWVESRDGLYQLSAGKNESFDPAQLVVPFPAVEHHRFHWSGSGPRPEGGSGAWSTSGEVLPAEPVDTEAGTMTAVPVQNLSSLDDTTCQSTTWFRPDVGMVRFYQAIASADRNQVLVITLKNYDLKP